MRRVECRCAFAIAAFALVGVVSARDVTNLTVAEGTATVTFEAGTEGDSHVLYYVWSNDGVDKGTTLAAWPNAYRVDRVADDATSYEFALPTEIMAHRPYFFAEAFFAASAAFAAAAFCSASILAASSGFNLPIDTACTSPKSILRLLVA